MIDPTNIDMTERGVLFAAIRNESVRAVLLANGHEDLFLDINHRRLFRAIASVVSKEIAVDVLGILRAARQNENASFGDIVLEPEWLSQALAECGDGVSVEALVDSHLPVLRLAHQARCVQEFFLKGVDKSLETGPEQLLNWATRELEKINMLASEKAITKNDHQIVLESMSEDEEEDFEINSGPLTRMPELDEMDFRLTPGQLITIAGRPGECKTLVATQIALGASTQCTTAVFALEDGIEGWQRRRLTMIAGQNGDVFSRPETDKGFAFERRSEYIAAACDRPLFIVEGSEGLSAFDIIAKIREMKTQHPDLGVVIIDQTYDIADYSDTRKGEVLTYSIFRLLSRLKSAAKALRVSIVVLQHVKDVQGRPTKNDIADSQFFYKLSRKVVITSHIPSEVEGGNPSGFLDVVKFTHGKPRGFGVVFDGEKQRLGRFVDPLYDSQYA